MDWKPYNCNVCGKSFSQQANLTDHQNIHYGNRPFQCKQCKKTYNNRGAYYNHMRIHNDDRFYVCPLCNANFMWEVSMKTHLNRHQRKGEITAKMAAEIYERTKYDVRLKKQQLKNAARELIENYIRNPTKTNGVPSMKSESSNYENLENWMCEASSSRTFTHGNETSSHLLNERTANSRINENPTLQFQDTNQTRNLYQNQFPWNTDHEEKHLLTYDPYDGMYRPINYTEMENFPSANNSFYEQPNASLYSNGESQTDYSPNLNRIYENNMENYIHEIPQNTTSQQQFIPQQPFHYTFGEQNNFQNVNTLGIINDHAYNANYGYYQQNLPQETFNQQFISKPEGYPYHQNNLQAVYANETVYPLSNYAQPQISSPQGTFNQQFIPQPEGNPYHENNQQAIYANETVDPLSNYWRLHIR
ncbi:Zinc finger protein with KRAB and SCAN domains 5 [Trichinella zimbabwensis]|uniref:Zinc finger protein with KRAB and SCAN domains 5 n=1 Tax=Trichinella zimbabwensis TaxID=268475 RepID=A0A0V1HW88_9BILA|nr:Zinc finger protein with KRAB and SCAN domains 5 [Trichinella zimbabwensis]